MELGGQIRKRRQALGLSQEELAERVYATRQSVSNWENDRTCPDIKSLLLLAEVFSASLDDLVKGDIAEMKKQIDDAEKAAFRRDSSIFTALFAAMLVTCVPLALLWRWRGLAAWSVLAAVAFAWSFRVERWKKKFDIQTYREIVAFTEGRTLSEIEKAREEGKRPYQKALLAAGSGLLGVAVSLIMLWLWRRFIL